MRAARQQLVEGQYSLQLPNFRDQSLSIIEHLAPTKKDLPIYLEGNFCRACADFGAAANIIDAEYALQINVVIVQDNACKPFLLPTFGRLIWPMGRAKILCVFPDEPLTEKVYDFFVFQHFVYPVILGQEFLRETGTLDLFQYRLYDRPQINQEIPIVAFLGAGEETLTIFLDGEELESIPDTGSEINAMSLEFAQKRGFFIETDNIHVVRFADGSLQAVIGRVTKPLSFKQGSPSSFLVRLVGQSSEVPEYQPGYEVAANSPIEDISIAAEFYILEGLTADIILGESILASVDAFVTHSQNFKKVESKNFYAPVATISLFKKSGRRLCRAAGRVVPEIQDPLRERNIADSKELDRYEAEKKRIESLTGTKKDIATRQNEQLRQIYLQNRAATPMDTSW